MKKLFLSVIIPATLLLTSCLDGDSETTTGIEPGVFIYGKARTQADLDLDPVLVALKLNTLIVTAGNSSWENVTVTLNPGESNEEKVNLKERLFGENTQITKAGNEWTINFNTSTPLTKEKLYRNGEITINTGGLDLQQLDFEADETWEISVPSDGYDVVFSASGGGKYINRVQGYTIAAAEDKDNTWIVTGRSTSYYDGYETLPANWDFEYEVNMLGDGTFKFSDMETATFLVSGSVEGTAAYTDYKITYRAEELKYKTRCNFFYNYGGAEYAGVERTAFTEEEMPATTVKYMWIDYSHSSPCYNSVTISYNGISVNS